MKIVRVELGKRSYEIMIGRGTRARVGQLCADPDLRLGSRCFVVTDTTVGTLYGRAVAEGLREAGFAAETVELETGRGRHGPRDVPIDN